MSTIGIVGGGISGLFLAFKLLSKNKGYNVQLFEKDSRLGGRIHTVYKENGISYDTGAGRFNDSHKELLKVLKELGLKDFAVPISNNNRAFVKDGQEQNYTALINGLLFDKVLKSRAKYTDDYLKSITLGEFVVKIIGQDKAKDIISAFGYNSEFEIHNAYTGLTIFEHDFNDNIQYYYLKGGLSQIIVLLHKKVIELGGKVHFNTSVNHYDPITNTVEYITKNMKKVKKLVCDKVVFCVTHDTLERFEDLLEYDDKLSKFLKGTQSAPLHRIYSQFPVEKTTGKAWFHDLPRVTTNLPIRYIIPHNPNNGFIQISYTDNKFADYWQSLSNEQREKQLMKNLKLVFPDRKIPKPIWIESYYWKEGVTYWKPNSVTYRNMKNNNYYICGEMMSPFHCGWIEGALKTSVDVLRLFA